MTTDSLKNDQLPNNRLTVFKSNNKQDIIELKLVLQNNTEINIPVSKDGYVNCTKLCQAGGKRIDNWNRLKQSEELLQTYSKLPRNQGTEKEVPRIPSTEKAVPHNRGTAFCRVIDGGNASLNNQGTYYPMDIAIQIAQWISPSFALQVSRWTRELLLFGKVELGQEKSNKELENKFQEQIKLLTQEKQQAIKEKEEVILEKANITRRLSSVTQNHNKMLKRRRRGVYEIGNVVYILSHVAFTSYYQDDYYKIGISTQSATETTPAFTNRLSSYKTGAPSEYKVHYLIYVENNKLIEDILKLKFKDQLNPSNGEWIKSVKLEEIIKSIRYLCDYIGLPCKEHSIMKNKNIVDDGKVLDCEDEENIELLSDKFTEIEIIDSESDSEDEGDKESIETDEGNTDSEQEKIDSEESEVKQVEMIEEIEKYDAKQLTKMLLEFELPVSGNKDAKKTRIREYAKKNKTVVNEYISSVMETEKQNFCIDCGTEITYKAARCEPCCRKSSRVVIDRPDYETLKKQYEDCGKNMRKLATIHNVSDKAVTKWFDKYEKDLGITKSCVKKNKPKSTIIKPSDEDLLYDKNVLKLNYTQLGKKYNIDRTTARDWLSTL
jgi:hypothetical protein